MAACKRPVTLNDAHIPKKLRLPKEPVYVFVMELSVDAFPGACSHDESNSVEKLSIHRPPNAVTIDTNAPYANRKQ
jgi:hypothetical protein